MGVEIGIKEMEMGTEMMEIEIKGGLKLTRTRVHVAR
jgi:hypothetical protein